MILFRMEATNLIFAFMYEKGKRHAASTRLIPRAKWLVSSLNPLTVSKIGSLLA